jgi:hypothetical protein
MWVYYGGSSLSRIVCVCVCVCVYMHSTGTQYARAVRYVFVRFHGGKGLNQLSFFGRMVPPEPCVSKEQSQALFHQRTSLLPDEVIQMIDSDLLARPQEVGGNGVLACDSWWTQLLHSDIALVLHRIVCTLTI